MKLLTKAQSTCALLAILLAWAYMSDTAFKEQELFVEQHIEQGRNDELNKPREALNRLQEDWDDKLALGEVK